LGGVLTSEAAAEHGISATTTAPSTRVSRVLDCRLPRIPKVPPHSRRTVVMQTQGDDVCLARQYIVGRVDRQQPAETKRVILAFVPQFVTRIVESSSCIRPIGVPRLSPLSSSARILRCRPPIRVLQYAPTLETSRSFAGCAKITRTLPQQSIFRSSSCSSSDEYSHACRCRPSRSMPST